jgi:hypothetical protein
MSMYVHANVHWHTRELRGNAQRDDPIDVFTSVKSKI